MERCGWYVDVQSVEGVFLRSEECGAETDFNTLAEHHAHNGSHIEHLLPIESIDPWEGWWMPGYATELDYMNACEADDYRNEEADF